MHPNPQEPEAGGSLLQLSLGTNAPQERPSGTEKFLLLSIKPLEGNDLETIQISTAQCKKVEKGHPVSQNFNKILKDIRNLQEIMHHSLDLFTVWDISFLENATQMKHCQVQII